MSDLRQRYDFLFDGTGDLTQETLLLYVFGPLENGARDAVEEHLAECEMCRDAAEGMALLGTKEQALAILVATDARLQERVELLKQKVTRSGREALMAETVAKEPTPLRVERRERRVGWYRYAAAASVVVVLGVAFWLVNQNIATEDTAITQARDEDSLGLFEKESNLKRNKAGSSAMDSAPTLEQPANDTLTVGSGVATTTLSTPEGASSYQWEGAEQEDVTAYKNLGAAAYSVTPADGNASKPVTKDVASKEPSAKYKAEDKKKAEAPAADVVALEEESNADVTLFRDTVSPTVASAPASGNATTEDATDEWFKADGRVATRQNDVSTTTLNKGTGNANFNYNNVAGMDVEINIAQYPGGPAEMQKYFDKAPYPNDLKKGYKGVVIFEVTFDAGGKLTNATLVAGLGDPYDKVLLEHLKKMPKWVPPSPAVASTRLVTIEVTVK